MEKITYLFKNAWPYKDDKMTLPVHDLQSALPFYLTVLGFELASRNDSPQKSVVLSRPEIQIGLAENGGDPSQEGCFFEVDNIRAAISELKSNGLKKENFDYSFEKHGDTSWKVFYVVAPDGLCYCYGEREG